MLFKKWSTRWAEQIAQTAGETDEYKTALMRYVFESVLSFCLSFLVLFILAWILGILKEALIIGFTGAVIKTFTGGLHMSTPLRCAVSGAITLAAISYLSILFPAASFPAIAVIIILALLNLIVWQYAPREAKGKPLSSRQKVILAWLSRLIILGISVWVFLTYRKSGWVNLVFYGTLFQVLNLLEVSSRGTAKLDHLLGKIEKEPLF
ncbi:MAG: accessory gene regulator B family protein [Firmicutes bacterium]|nr:accessory gene regulator B family protein [Bacillota bacterium]